MKWVEAVNLGLQHWTYRCNNTNLCRPIGPHNITLIINLNHPFSHSLSDMMDSSWIGDWFGTFCMLLARRPFNLYECNKYTCNVQGLDWIHISYFFFLRNSFARLLSSKLRMLLISSWCTCFCFTCCNAWSASWWCMLWYIRIELTLFVFALLAGLFHA